MGKFRKKPVIVEVDARRFDPNLSRNQWPFGVVWEPEFRDQDGSRLGGFYKLQLFGGFNFVQPGDWIVRGEKPEPQVYKPDVFEATYEPAE